MPAYDRMIQMISNHLTQVTRLEKNRRLLGLEDGPAGGRVPIKIKNLPLLLTDMTMIYNTNLNKLQVYNGSAWETVTSS